MSVVYFLLAWATAWGGTLQVEVLDIGQGDAILLTTPAGKHVLIDGGTGRRSIVRVLENREITSLDLVINTHAHADHIGGLDEVIEAVEVKAYVDSGVPHTTETYKKVIDLVEAREINYKAVRTGQMFRLDDGITIEVLGPEKPLLSGTRSDLNSNSVITRIEHKKVCFLMMGDAEAETEHRVLEDGLEPCEVLKVAHHGSRYASSKKFLAAAQPEWAAISVGRKNRYKHPAPETVRRLEKAGAKVLRTDLHGRVLFESNGRKVQAFISRENPDLVLPPGVTVKKPPRAETTAQAGKEEKKSRRVVDGSALSKGTPTASAPVPGKVRKELQDAVAASASSAERPTSGGGVNLNSASAEDLVRIPGIGPAKASAIVAYREANGPFSRMADVDKVPGIGPATLKNIEAHATIVAPSP